MGGYNSSNTTHLVELLEQKYPTYFIKDVQEIKSDQEIQHFDIHAKSLKITDNYLLNTDKPTIILTSGASCPDSMVDEVMFKILAFFDAEDLRPTEEVIAAI